MPVSRHNPERGDEREFPEFESPEYADLPAMDGTSVYLINKYTIPTKRAWEKVNMAERPYITIVEAGDYYSQDDVEYALDNYEVLAINPVVVQVISLPQIGNQAYEVTPKALAALRQAMEDNAKCKTF